MRILTCSIALALLCFTQPAKASHSLGGSITYSFIGDSLSYKVYEVKLVIFQDAAHGQPISILEDNPAFIAIYDANATAGYPLFRADSIFYSLADIVATGP